MNQPKLLALFAALCMSQGCIFAESEVTPAGPAADQGQVVADMGDALDQSAGPDLSGPDLSAPDLDPSPDQGGADMPPADMPPADMGADMMCPSADDQCEALQIECGQTSYPDQCDLDSAERVLLNCGDCKDKGGTFLCQENKCVDNCMPREDDELCSVFACGLHTVTDCGVDREVTCPNTCDDATEICTQAGTCCNKIAGAATARQALRDMGKCGMQRATICGEETTLALSMNCDDYAADQGNVPGSYQCLGDKCTCVGQPDQTLCDDAQLECGTATLTDWCGASRPVNCGGCGLNRCCPDKTCSVLGVCS